MRNPDLTRPAIEYTGEERRRSAAMITHVDRTIEDLGLMPDPPSVGWELLTACCAMLAGMTIPALIICAHLAGWI